MDKIISNFNMVKDYIKEQCVEWIQKWFEYNGEGCNAIVGISGGKDSAVVAALCVAALGKDRVIGVKMPCGEQSDIDDAQGIIDFLGIKSVEINIKDSVEGIIAQMAASGITPSEQTLINLPARIRMSTLYAISQTYHGRVANTCNLSEDYVGYATRYGDGAGDFSPLGNLTRIEVILLGKALGIPDKYVEKTPSDGLCGKTDEDNLGFTYDVLDKYILTGEIEDKEIKEKIDTMHKKNEFKLKPILSFVKFDERKGKYHWKA